MAQSYSSTIKQHYRNPLNAGKLSDYTHSAEAINPLCGDETKVYLKISSVENARGHGHFPQSAIIQDISHETRGCIICVAAASVVSEFARGKNISKIKKLGVQQVSKLLNVSVSPAREQCAKLFLRAVVGQ